MNNFKINFITFSPTPTYVDYIGGSMVCHNLAHNLSILGENSYLYANSTKEGYKSSLIPWGSDIDFDEQNTILILPSGGGEHTYESYLSPSLTDIPNNVRWLMNDQVKEYSKSDKLYKFVDYFSTFPQQHIDGDLMSIDVDQNLFINYNLPRKGNCFYSKGLTITPQNQLHPSDSICLDQIYSMSSEERNRYLVEIFNKSELFICYSNRTFMATLAALCGCPVVVIPTEGVEKSVWRKGFPTLKYGIAYGEKDMDWAISTLPLVQSLVKDLKKQSLDQTQTFINDCYQWLKNKYNI
jgi:hypothetical protein